ncbi:TNF receptor-associated factor 4, partial [Geodia barretti]
RECVEQIKEDDKPCPLCNKTDFTYIRDYGLERYLKAQEVWCSHKKDGCEWRGKLGEYEQHLNENPSPENKLTGCQFVEIECEHVCGERFQRRHIASHQNQHCTKRPYSCKYCQKFEATYKYVTTCHYYECDDFPVTCPNKCRKDHFKRHALYKHVKDECPLTEIDCPLHYAGCEVRLPRKDMPEHMTDTVTHLTLLATVTQSLFRENQELRQTNHELRKQNELLKDKQNATEKEVEILKETL